MCPTNLDKGSNWSSSTNVAFQLHLKLSFHRVDPVQLCQINSIGTRQLHKVYDYEECCPDMCQGILH